MKFRKSYLLLLSIVLLPLVYYYITRIYEPKKHIAEWEERTDQFVSDGLLKEGDIVFQITASKQSKAIQLATHSKWDHVGVVFKEKDGYYVYEAVQPVKKTPIARWFARCKENTFAIRRLKESIKQLGSHEVDTLKYVASKYIDKNYDIYFEWSDERQYCSEYVWKIFKRALDVEISSTQTLKDCDLSSEEVRKVMNERYGSNVPLDETVVSPGALYLSDKLITVKEQ